ncbi:MAG: AMP-binding protein [Desulfobacteraceae bacterium]|nr:AMP-binding protein [Desulfobacteraceae bacterium]
MGLYDFSFYDVIERCALCFGNRPAWYEVDDGRTVTFSEAKTLVDRLAAGLQRIGLKKGDRIGILGKNSLEYFLLYGAAAATGVIVLPINWRLSADEVVGNLSDCEPSVLFVDEAFQELVESSRAELSSIRACYNLKDETGRYSAFQDLMTGSDGFSPVEVKTDDGFVIIHTAAVEGKPRGALLSHGNICCVNLHWNYAFQMVPEDVHLNLLPLFHIGGLSMATMAFHAGALNVNMSKFDAPGALDLIEAKGVSLFFDFSPILGSILDEAEKTHRDLSSLRLVVGLEAPEVIERYQQVTGGDFFVMYGQTETSCLVSCAKYNDRPGSAGKPIPLAQVRLVDESDRPVDPGQVGEITLRGPMVFRGYWNLTEETKQTFRGGWHHTGDTGRFDADGYLFYAGRKAEKELIKPGGENVYPAEVEKVILEHPAVEKTVVFGVPDPKWKEGIKAVCVLRKRHSLQPQELIDFVGSRIARYKKPRYVEIVADLPETEDGQVDRAKVKEMYTPQ